MAQWISKDGTWYPSKEKSVLKNTSGKTIVNPSSEGNKYAGEEVGVGEDFVYEGPDRDAMFELYKTKEEHLGMDFHNDPDLVSRVRQLGYKSVAAYAKAMGYDKAKVEKNFVEKASVISKHELPAKVKAIEVAGGGQDTTGVQETEFGGFGQPKSKE